MVSGEIREQKWLLNYNVELANWQAGDLIADDKLNVLDLCAMKRMLIK